MEWNIPQGHADSALSQSDSGFDLSRPTGKSAGGGFVSSGLGSVLGLVCLPVKTLNTRCCGVIGKSGNKMCLEVDCTKSAHRTKVDLDSIYQEPYYDEDSSIVFISTSVESDSSVYVTPSLPSTKFGVFLERYLQDKRDLSSWELLFQQLDKTSADDNQGIADLEELARRLDEEGGKMDPITPMKKRPKLNIDSPSIAAEAEIALFPLVNDLGMTSEQTLRSLRKDWTLVGDNFASLERMMSSSRAAISGLSEGVKESSQDVDTKLARLDALIGKRPSNLGTTSAFSYLEFLSSKLEAQNLELTKCLRFISNDDEATDEFKKEIYHTVMKSFAPLFSLFGRFSSSKASPGDLLDKELLEIKKELSVLKKESNRVSFVPNSTPPSTSQSTASGLDWGVNQMGNSPPVTTNPSLGGINIQQGSSVSIGNGTHNVSLPHSSQELSAMESKLASVIARIDDVEQQLSATAVIIGGVTFKSLASVKSWLSLEVRAKEGYIQFIDAHAMMSLAFPPVDSSSDIIEFEASAIKAGYGSTDSALILPGFKFGLPSFFGKDSANNLTTKDTRVLPSLRQPEDWDAGDGFTGARRQFEKKIKDLETEKLKSVKYILSGDGLVVASACIQASAAFLRRLGEWISQEFRDLLNRGGSKTECWLLISHCVRAVWDHLHEARSSGRGPWLSESDKAAGVVWGFLQSHRQMADYVENGFASSATLSHILNVHLRDHAVTTAQFEEVLSMLTAAQEKIKEAQKTADKAYTTATKKVK